VFYSMSVLSQESEQSCMCVRGINFFTQCLYLSQESEQSCMCVRGIDFLFSWRQKYLEVKNSQTGLYVINSKIKNL
jgi:hypothetical protein